MKTDTIEALKSVRDNVDEMIKAAEQENEKPSVLDEEWSLGAGGSLWRDDDDATGAMWWMSAMTPEQRKLIAAAPDMARVIKEMDRLMSTFGYISQTQTQNIRPAIREALDKAGIV